MRQHKNFSKQIIRNRLRAILELIKKGEVSKIEKELALFVLEILNALQAKETSFREGCKCFIKILYAINLELDSKLSEEFHDLLNEAVLLDEVGTKYGPSLTYMHELATKILTRDKEVSLSKLKQKVV